MLSSAVFRRAAAHSGGSPASPDVRVELITQTGVLGSWNEISSIGQFLGTAVGEWIVGVERQLCNLSFIFELDPEAQIRVSLRCTPFTKTWGNIFKST